MQYAEDETDVNNVEAWAELITHVLDRVPFDRRMQVLQLAGQGGSRHRRAEKIWRFLGGIRGRLANNDWRAPGSKHWNTIMRLKSLIIQVFARTISNSHSPRDAAKLLFAEHPYGTGSRYLGDCIHCARGRVSPSQDR